MELTPLGQHAVAESFGLISKKNKQAQEIGMLKRLIMNRHLIDI